MLEEEIEKWEKVITKGPNTPSGLGRLTMVPGLTLPPYGDDSPLGSQVGGAHYKQYKIQPIEYAMANKLNYCQANAIKYITRYRDKGGKEDLRKAIHNLEILMELEYGRNGQDRQQKPTVGETAQSCSSGPLVSKVRIEGSSRTAPYPTPRDRGV